MKKARTSNKINQGEMKVLRMLRKSSQINLLASQISQIRRTDLRKARIDFLSANNQRMPLWSNNERQANNK